MLRVVLTGMFAMAVRYDVLTVNPIREDLQRQTQGPDARSILDRYAEGK